MNRRYEPYDDERWRLRGYGENELDQLRNRDDRELSFARSERSIFGEPSGGGAQYGRSEHRRDEPYRDYAREIYSQRSGYETLGHYGERQVGEGGWLEGQDAVSKRAVRRGPKGYRRSDSRIEDDINERLMRADHIDSSDVTVRVQNGSVTLEGTVPERWMRYAIENEADECWGVDNIDNNIRVRR